MIYYLSCIVISAVGCAVLIAYMKMLVWDHLSDFSWKDTLVALISPTICLVVSGACAMGIHYNYTEMILWRVMTPIMMIFILLITLWCTWRAAVKNYIAEDVEPNYGSAVVVGTYSVLLFASLFFTF